MKVMSKGQIKKNHEERLCFNERNVLMDTELQRNTTGVLSLKYSFRDASYIYLVMRYCPGI